MRVLWDLFFTFFKTGIFTVGGGMAMIPIIFEEATEKKGWMTREEMLDCVAVTQSLPGAMIINTATYIGKKEKGLAGSIAATVGVMLPSFIMMILAMVLLESIGDNVYVNGALEGAKAGAVGLVLIACYRLGKPIMKKPTDFIIAIVAFSMVVVLKLSPIWAVLFGLISGLVLFSFRQIRKRRSK